MPQHSEALIGHNPALHPYGAGHSMSSIFYEQSQNSDDFLVSYEAQLYAVFGDFYTQPNTESNGISAARIAVETFYNSYKDQPGLVSSDALAVSGMKQALLAAHRNIIDARYDSDGRYRSLGSVAAAALHFYETEVGDARAVVGHHAFNRAYRLPVNGRLQYLTLDYDFDDDWRAAPTHSHWKPEAERTWKEQEFYDQITDYHSIRRRKFEKMKPQLMLDFFSWNRIGQEVYDVPPTKVTAIDVQEDDRFLLTSDGIHKNLTKSEIEEILKGTYEPQQAAAELVVAARERSEMHKKPNVHHRARPDDMTAVVINTPRKS